MEDIRDHPVIDSMLRTGYPPWIDPDWEDEDEEEEEEEEEEDG